MKTSGIFFFLCYIATSVAPQNQDITIRDLEGRLLSMEGDIEQQVVQRVKSKEVSTGNMTKVLLVRDHFTSSACFRGLRVL